MSGAPSQVTWSLAIQTFGPQEHQHHGGGYGWGAIRHADSQAPSRPPESDSASSWHPQVIHTHTDV